MDPATIAILVTLIAYKCALLTIGWLAARRTRDEVDFYLGGRKLGPLVAAISASASSSSVWTLLGVSGFAFKYGLSALWLIPSCIGGFALNWFLIAPRLRARSGEALTVTEWLADTGDGRWQRAVRILASLIVLFCFLFYVASQFGGAGDTFESTLGMGRVSSVVLGAVIIAAYTLLGGFWAVSITDTLQGLMMAGTAVLLPLAALLHVGGPAGLVAGLGAIDEGGYLSLGGARGDLLAIGFVLGTFGIGLGYPGQPHVINRFMALRDADALRRAQKYALCWAVVVYVGMVTLGLCARLFIEAGPGPRDHERIFFMATLELFPPVLAGVMIAAALSAIMSTADSQLLVCASSVTHDLAGDRVRRPLLVGRLVVVALSALAVALALIVSETIFDKVLFAWSALAAAFGPLVVVRLWRGPVTGKLTLAAMAVGFFLAVTAYLAGQPITGTKVDERVLPLVVALAIAWFGARGASRAAPIP